MLVLSHSDTHTTSMGIWDGAGATKSWLHSGTLKKVFCPDKKKSQLKRNFLSGWWEKRWTMTMRNELETLKKLFWWGKNVWCHAISIPCCESVIFLLNFFEFCWTAFEMYVFLYFSVPQCEGWLWLCLIRCSKLSNSCRKWQSPLRFE